jgi:hypothetical protein
MGAGQTVASSHDVTDVTGASRDVVARPRGPAEVAESGQDPEEAWPQARVDHEGGRHPAHAPCTPEQQTDGHGLTRSRGRSPRSLTAGQRARLSPERSPISQLTSAQPACAASSSDPSPRHQIRSTRQHGCWLVSGRPGCDQVTPLPSRPEPGCDTRDQCPSLRCLTLEQPAWRRLEVRIGWSVGSSSWPRLTMGYARGAVCGGSKPERDLGRLCGLVNDRQQLG